MTYSAARHQAAVIARDLGQYCAVIRHPVTGEYGTATQSELYAPKDRATNPDGYPSVQHIVIGVEPPCLAE